MSSAIIPATVPADGPQFQRFPNEVLIQILKHLLVFSASHDGKTQRFIVLNGRFSKMLRVSKGFAGIAREAFYGNNFFKFDRYIVDESRLNQWLAKIPPVSLRKFLRRIQITVMLSDRYFTVAPGNNNTTTTTPSYISQRIVGVNQLLLLCHGAGQLHNLTQAVTGFDRLEVLDILIRENFRYDIDTSLALYQAAGFLVRAGKVSISALPPRKGEQHYNFPKPWFPRLVETITVQETGLVVGGSQEAM